MQFPACLAWQSCEKQEIFYISRLWRIWWHLLDSTVFCVAFPAIFRPDLHLFIYLTSNCISSCPFMAEKSVVESWQNYYVFKISLFFHCYFCVLASLINSLFIVAAQHSEMSQLPENVFNYFIIHHYYFIIVQLPS